MEGLEELEANHWGYDVQFVYTNVRVLHIWFSQFMSLANTQRVK